jgi:hypothetical protein
VASTRVASIESAGQRFLADASAKFSELNTLASPSVTNTQAQADRHENTSTLEAEEVRALVAPLNDSDDEVSTEPTKRDKNSVGKVQQRKKRLRALKSMRKMKHASAHATDDDAVIPAPSGQGASLWAERRPEAVKLLSGDDQPSSRVAVSEVDAEVIDTGPQPQDSADNHSHGTNDLHEPNTNSPELSLSRISLEELQELSEDDLVILALDEQRTLLNTCENMAQASATIGALIGEAKRRLQISTAEAETVYEEVVEQNDKQARDAGSSSDAAKSSRHHKPGRRRTQWALLWDRLAGDAKEADDETEGAPSDASKPEPEETGDEGYITGLWTYDLQANRRYMIMFGQDANVHPSEKKPLPIQYSLPEEDL